MRNAATVSPTNSAGAASVAVSVAELRGNGLLRTLEAEGFSISARATSVGVLVERLNGDMPKAFVLTAKHADGEALNSIRTVRSRAPQAAIVLVADRAANGDVRKALDAGADGILTTDRVSDCLAATLRGVLAGQVVVPQEARDLVRRPVLTTREKQILGLVVMGLSNNEIASKLFLAESTVKSHLSSAFSKLSVASRNEAVSLILDPERGRGLGILTIPSERI